MAEKSQQRSTGKFRFFLIIFNFSLFASGTILTGFGSFLLYAESKQGLRDTIPPLPLLVTIQGISIIVFGITGRAGAFMESKFINNLALSTLISNHLFQHLLELLLLIVAELGIGILLIVLANETAGQIELDLKRFINEYENGTLTARKLNVLQQFQRNLHCCGIKGPDDYSMPHKVCCDIGSICVTYPTEGCISAVSEVLTKHKALIGGVVIGLAFMEIGAVVSSKALG